jgi:diguanylate cyclase (GGDEF)-like protein
LSPYEKPASLLFFDLNDFKKINDTYGHKEGDAVLVTFAGLLQKAFRDCDVIGRLGGDEFVVLLTDSNCATTSECIQRFNKMLDVYNSEAHRGYYIHYSVGQIEYDVERHSSINSILSDADAAMYANKRELKAPSERHES